MVLKLIGGRHGIEFTPYTQDYCQWFFYGVYYHTRDHKLLFKKNNKPELTFFFDCYDRATKDKMTNGEEFKESVERLIEKGFEENISGDKANFYRVIFKRKPLSDFDKIDMMTLKNEFKEIMSEILQEKPFRKMILSID